MAKAEAAVKSASPASAEDKTKEAQLPAVASKQGGAVTEFSAFDEGMEKFASAGLENVTAKDLLIPRLTIIQALSPQIDKNKPEYMPGVERGQICDVGLQEIIPAPMLFIPVYFMTQYLEWKPGRKGLANIHNDPEILSQCTQNDKRQYVLPNGNIVSETAQFYGLNATADYRFSFIPMTSTQLKKARRWNTLATSEKALRRDGTEFTPPLFYRAYVLSTVAESNDQGSWDGWKIERGPKIEEIDGAAQKVFDLATGFYEQLKSGRARGDVESMAGEEVAGGNSDKM